MKTKNIFRMLLVAAALLMGANNVKADEVIELWDNNNVEKAMSFDDPISLEQEDLERISEGDELRFYGKVTNASDGNRVLGLYTANNNSIIGTFYEWLKDPFTNGVATYVFTKKQVEDLISYNSEGAPLLAVAKGINMTITRIDVLHKGSSKTTPILSFGEGAQETYNITLDDSFTGPTATCNIDGLEITYSSSETSVAEVGYSTGALTIKKAGTTVITAQTEPTEDYNAASISYTLNIAMAYSVTVNAVSNGSVSVDKSSTAAGQTVTITTTPNSGYELNKISVKDASNNTVTLSGEGNTRTFTMPASNVTVSAEFTKSYSAAEADKHPLTFTTNDTYYAANWDSSTNIFSWGPGYQASNWSDHPEWTFMTAVDINGNLSNWTHLHLHVSNWINASAEKLTVVFKTNDGSWPPNGPTKEIEVSPNASGNIDIDLPPTGGWGNVNNFDISKIQDLTIYGCARDDESLVASVVITDAYYVTAAASETYTVSVSAGSNGSASVDKTSAAEGETVTVTISPNSGYELGSISAVDASNNQVTLNGSGNTRTFTMPASNVTVTVTFNEIANQYFDVEMGSYDYRTFVYDYAIDFSKAVGLKGYYAKEVSDNEVVFEQVTGIVNANTPLLLKKTDGATTTNLWWTNTEGTTPSPNLLVAGDGGEIQDANYYVLTYHWIEAENGYGYVFAGTTYKKAKVDTDRAYLDLSGTNASGRLRIRLNGESTGISTIQNDERSLDGAVYNLRGQRVEHPTKGLYIINGKKVVIK